MTPAPVRVLHAIDALGVGGAEALLTALVRSLAEQGLAQNTVLVVYPARAHPAYVEDLRAHSEWVRFIEPYRARSPKLFTGALRAVRDARPDVVHSHLATANVATRVATRVLRIPHVTTIHTVPGPAAEDTRRQSLADGWSAHLSRRLVSPSAEVSDAFAAAFHIPRARMLVIPNAPAAAPPGADFDRARSRADAFGPGAAGFCVLCIARLVPEKGVAELVEAVARLRDGGREVTVAVAGGGPEEAELHRRAAELGVASAVRLLGQRSDIGDLLRAADAFCLPSRHEGLPVSVLEAMDAGLPVVATAVGGVPTLVLDGETGLLVEPREPEALAEALAGLADHPERRAALGAGGRALVAGHYSLGAVAARYAELYRELAAG